MQKSLLAVFAPLLTLTLAACNHGSNQVVAASSEPSPAPPAAAQDSSPASMQIKLSSTHRTYACHNSADAVQVTGSSDVLTITGSCGSLQVTGSSNSIIIDSVRTVQFTGNSNSVLYRSGAMPVVGDEGHSNALARATAQGAASDDNAAVSSSRESDSAVSGSVGAAVSSALQAANAASQAAASTAGVVQGVQMQGNVLNIILSNQRTTQDCGDGKVVNINGYQNDITLTGSCAKVALNGWGNTIHIEEVASIEVTGHTNSLTWGRGRNVRRPAVQIDTGTDNSVRHVASANQ
jgi:hypothetical protein